jgi:hypothetical protein
MMSRKHHPNNQQLALAKGAEGERVAARISLFQFKNPEAVSVYQIFTLS